MAKPDKIMAQELLQLEVLDLTAGEIAGRVMDLALTKDGIVSQIGILPVTWFGGGRGIAPGAIASINQERICIEDSNALEAFDPDGESLLSMVSEGLLPGKQVLRQDGEMLGLLVDFSFNLDDGKIIELIVLGDNDKRSKVPVDLIRTIGRDYIVIEKGQLGAESAPALGDEPAKKPITEPAEEPVTAQDAEFVEEGTIEETVEPITEEPVELEDQEETARPETKKKGSQKKPKDKPEQKEEIPKEEESAPIEEEGSPEVPPELEEAPPEAPTEKSEEEALFEDSKPVQELSKFDQKKRDFLLNRKAHRDIKDSDGNNIVSKDQVIDEVAINQIISEGMLGDIFIELTLKK